MERYCSNPTAGLIKNKTNKCPSIAEGDDDSYVEMNELCEGQSSSQSTDSDDNDNDYVNTLEPDCHPTSKQSTELHDDDDDDYINTMDEHRDQTFKQDTGYDDDDDDDDGGGEDYIELDDHPIPENSTVPLDAHNHVIQRKPASSNRGLKIVLVILVILLLGALAALCAVMILYLNNVAALHTTKEQHNNTMANMTMQQHKASVRMDIYTDLKKKYLRAQEFFSTCNVSGFCDEGWKLLGFKCYFFTDEKLNWTKSRDSCVKKGADLAIITSKAEQSFVSSQANESSWIGLNYPKTEGTWMWVNNQTLEETNVTFWNEAPKSPSEESAPGEYGAALLQISQSAHHASNPAELELETTENWSDESSPFSFPLCEIMGGVVVKAARVKTKTGSGPRPRGDRDQITI